VPDEYYECAVEGYAQFPFAEFVFLPSEGRTVLYEQRYRTLVFKEFGVQSIENAPEIDTTIQGHQYLNCWSRTYSDSLGEISSVIVDQHFGLVMFSYRDEYRWERVLD